MKDLEVWPKKMGCKPEIRWGPDGIFDSHPSHVNWPALVNEYSKPCSLVITFDVGLNYRMCTTCLVCFLFIISVSQSCTMGILFFSQYFSLNPSPGFEHCSDPAASHESRTMPVRGFPTASWCLVHRQWPVRPMPCLWTPIVTISLSLSGLTPWQFLT